MRSTILLSLALVVAGCNPSDSSEAARATEREDGARGSLALLTYEPPVSLTVSSPVQGPPRPVVTNKDIVLKDGGRIITEGVVRMSKSGTKAWSPDGSPNKALKQWGDLWTQKMLKMYPQSKERLLGRDSAFIVSRIEGTTDLVEVMPDFTDMVDYEKQQHGNFVFVNYKEGNPRRIFKAVRTDPDKNGYTADYTVTESNPFVGKVATRPGTVAKLGPGSVRVVSFSKDGAPQSRLKGNHLKSFLTIKMEGVPEGMVTLQLIDKSGFVYDHVDPSGKLVKLADWSTLNGKPNREAAVAYRQSLQPIMGAQEGSQRGTTFGLPVSTSQVDKVIITVTQRWEYKRTGIAGKPK